MNFCRLLLTCRYTGFYVQIINLFALYFKIVFIFHMLIAVFTWNIYIYTCSPYSLIHRVHVRCLIITLVRDSWRTLTTWSTWLQWHHLHLRHLLVHLLVLCPLCLLKITSLHSDFVVRLRKVLQRTLIILPLSCKDSCKPHAVVLDLLDEIPQAMYLSKNKLLYHTIKYTQTQNRCKFWQASRCTSTPMPSSPPCTTLLRFPAPSPFGAP